MRSARQGRFGSPPRRKERADAPAAGRLGRSVRSAPPDSTVERLAVAAEEGGCGPAAFGSPSGIAG
ncbi:hypothetical protein [Streptomyces hiroshimensis]|uniref:Uncharacterized protein n=1 Tax=Streptomyces hiroshimensis TaxID=66424 RepID=A0ABQ2Y8V6_9ACTN|nr:hypothetical protein [Streptomyces hiroshimensis]GGX72048.1 hypothetical protein GCM10010324_16610 [Streptomyces hiroshimensis]